MGFRVGVDIGGASRRRHVRPAVHVAGTVDFARQPVPYSIRVTFMTPVPGLLRVWTGPTATRVPITLRRVAGSVTATAAAIFGGEQSA